MNRRSFATLRRNSFLLFILLCFSASLALAAPPEWLRAAARTPVPTYSAETDGVVLLDEQTTEVSQNGDIFTVYRRAVKILRPNALYLSRMSVHFDSETRLTWLKGWSITAKGEEYEVKEKDAVETNAFSDALYQDMHLKLLEIPGAAVGTVIGYEYQQKRRSSVLQDWWMFQETMPVISSKFRLRLPRGWEYQTYWSNHEKIEPQHTGENEFTWEISNVPELAKEDYMPPPRAIAGNMVLHFFPGGGTSPKSVASWNHIAEWYSNLVSDRRNATPEIKAQVQSLTAGATTTLEKISRLAAWVQRDVRYVAVEIGIGGYQPHFANETFKNRYGDCKDKATLLSTMLREIGVQSDYLVVQTVRGIVRPEVPSTLTFNHVILAIHLPADVPTDGLRAIIQHPKYGKLLIFDPTSERTSIGDLPSSLQDNNGLLVADKDGEVIKLPLLSPETNRLERIGKLTIGPDGQLTGSIDEIRTGQSASDARGVLLSSQLSDRSKSIEAFLNNHLGSYQMTKATVGDLNLYDKPLIVSYTFTAPQYGKTTGPLMLVRPRVVGRKTWSIMEGKKRTYPVEFDNASDERDSFEITLPEGYAVDELPDPVDVKYDFGEYHSEIKQTDNKLRYTRRYVIRQVIVPNEKLDQLKTFFRQIAADERSTAVLKKVK